MNKYKIGDILESPMTKIKIYEVRTINQRTKYNTAILGENVKFWLTESYLDRWFKLVSRDLTLYPGEEWTPENEILSAGIQYNLTVDKNKPDSSYCNHEWRDVVLFSSTVTECKKCGKLKE